jgi:hypothetical protein
VARENSGPRRTAGDRNFRVRKIRWKFPQNYRDLIRLNQVDLTCGLGDVGLTYGAGDVGLTLGQSNTKAPLTAEVARRVTPVPVSSHGLLETRADLVSWGNRSPNFPKTLAQVGVARERTSVPFVTRNEAYYGGKVSLGSSQAAPRSADSTSPCQAGRTTATSRLAPEPIKATAVIWRNDSDHTA